MNRLRFAPPRAAARVNVAGALEGDWARSMGYWWRVTNRRESDANGMALVDLESPRGRHVAVYAVHLMEARREI